MSLLAVSTSILQLEESLLILEESLQPDTIEPDTRKRHIHRLKQFYSPLFDFEHSESGSYYYAALKCIEETYINTDSTDKLPLSSLFKQSTTCMLRINTLSLDTKRNKNGIAESLIELAQLWQLYQSHDMADLLTKVLSQMRNEVTSLLNNQLN